MEDAKLCPYCAEPIKAAAIVCRYCGRSLTSVLEDANRRSGEWSDLLEQKVSLYLRNGYVITTHSSTVVTLKKPKDFDWIAFLVFFGLLYLIYYFAQRDKQVTLRQLLNGSIEESGYTLQRLQSDERSRRSAWYLILGLVLLLLVLLAVLCVQSVAMPQLPPKTAAQLPSHYVNDIDIPSRRGVISIFIVADADLPESDARALIDHYTQQYPDAIGINVDIFCDSDYATYTALMSPAVSDAEYYSHVLYSCQTGLANSFYTPANPYFPGQGSACRIHSLTGTARERPTAVSMPRPTNTPAIFATDSVRPPCTTASITYVEAQPDRLAFYITNSEMPIVEITAITLASSPETYINQVDLEPETLVRYPVPQPSPLVLPSSAFAQPALVGFGTRALIFVFVDSAPISGYSLAVELDNACTIHHQQ